MQRRPAPPAYACPDRAGPRPRCWPGPVRRRQAGLSLIEMMVGLVLGMLAIVIVMQVFQLSEGSKRTAMGGDDAQNNGALALTALQRDLRQGGYGSPAFEVMGCSLGLPGGRTLSNWGPVGINHPDIPAGDDDTDTLLIFFGDGAGSPEGDRVLTQPGAAIYSVATPTAFNERDQVVAALEVRPAPCALSMTAVLNVTSPAPPNVTVEAGVVNMANGRLYNLGTAPRLLAYAVRRGNLTLCDMMTSDCSDDTKVGDPTVWVAVGNNIVSLRAQYGRDTAGGPMDGVVDAFDQAAPVTACEWRRIGAVRLVVVARSAQFEREAVTTETLAWAGSEDQPIVLDNLADWQNYRYRSYQTLVPLRNIGWQGGQAGC